VLRLQCLQKLNHNYYQIELTEFAVDLKLYKNPYRVYLSAHSPLELPSDGILLVIILLNKFANKIILISLDLQKEF
jgi:hypothetical protein